MEARNLTDEQIIAKEMLADLVTKLRTAIDEGYLDPETLEIRRHVIRTRSNNNLRGGFNGEYKLHDLEQDLKLWKTPRARNQLFGVLGLPPLELSELMTRLKETERSRQNSNKQKSPDESAIGSYIVQAFPLIERHPEATGRTVRFFVGICAHAQGKGPFIEANSAREFAASIGMKSLYKPADQVRILLELRLLAQEESGFRLLTA